MFFYNPVKLYFYYDSCSVIRKELENKKYLNSLFIVWNRKVLSNETLDCVLTSVTGENSMIVEFDRSNPDIGDFL
jgi:hypothetical protein